MLRLAVASPSPDIKNAHVDPVVFGERVRDLRRKKKLTQKQLAEAAGVTENTLRGLERGTLQTRRPKIEAVVGVLETTIELLERVDLPISEGHPLLVGLNDEDLRIAQAYSRARTATRLRVERVLLTAEGDAGLTVLDRILSLDDRRREMLLQTLTQMEHAIQHERELAKKKKPPTP